MTKKTGVRVLLRHCWKKGQSARAAAKEIWDVEGEGAVSKSTAASWFKRFQDGDMSVEDRPHTGRPSELDDEALFQGVQEEPEASVRSLSDGLDCHNSTIDRHLQGLGLSKKRGREVPHELTPEQARRRVDICRQLLANPLDDRFFRRIVTCDEKRIFLRNPDTRRQWVFPGQGEPVAKRGRFEPKVMLCVWCGTARVSSTTTSFPMAVP